LLIKIIKLRAEPPIYGTFSPFPLSPFAFFLPSLLVSQDQANRKGEKKRGRKEGRERKSEQLKE